MNTTWPEFFKAEHAIRTCALRAGLAPERAASIAEELACRPLPRSVAARLLAALARPCTDAPVVAAHALLAQLEPDHTPPLALIRVEELPPGVFGECARGGVMTVSPSSPFYKAAETGDLMPLAMLIHHEHFHALHGAAEPPAFAASLKFLERYHADAALVQTVTQAYRAACHTFL